MEIRIQSIHFDADKKLLEHIEERVQKLSTIFERIVDIDVYLKFESASSQVKDKTAELKINLPGATLFATSTNKSFEEAIDHDLSSIKRQLKKYKEKIKN